MKLLFLTEFFPNNDQLIFTGGVEARTYYTATQAKKDFTIKVIASASKQVPATPFSVFSRAIYLVTAFFRAVFTDFDLIEASNVVTYLPAFLAARLKKKPVIIWVPDVLGKNWLDFGWFVGVVGWLVEKLYLRLNWDGVIALSESTRVKLLKAGIKTKNLTVIHGGIDPSEYKIMPLPPKFQQKTIVCIARLVKTKRIDVLLKAMALLNNYSQWRLLIVGRGPQQRVLTRLTKALKLERVKQIAYLPRQELIETLFRSHIFCLPSVVEGFGLVTIEAMACGLPAVLSSIPVNQEITHFGRGAVFFQPDNESDLAKKLSKLILDPDFYQKKQTEALKLAKVYTWQKVYEQTKFFYETCLSH